MMERELDNRLALLELLDEPHGPSGAIAEGVGPHGAAYFDVSAFVGEVEKPVLKFDGRRVVANEDRAHPQVHCTHFNTLQSNPSISARAVSEGSAERIANGCGFRAVVANDNPANDDWSPLDAA